MHILVTTDGSERSLHVLPHAQVMARGLDCDLKLLRVITREGEFRTDEAIAAHQQSLAGVLRDHGSDGQAIVEVQQVGESVADAILRVARESGASVIASAMRGAGALHHALFGSVAIEVLGKSPVPVLATAPWIGEPVPTEPYHLAVAVDDSGAAEELIEAIAALVTGTPARVTLAHIHESRLGDADDRSEMDRSRAYLEVLADRLLEGTDVSIRIEQPVGFQSVPDALRELLVGIGPSLVAVASKGTSRSRHLLLGDTGLSLVDDGRLPVLLVRAR
jgi:nucleotide-binding universal stress UspA family protein